MKTDNWKPNKEKYLCKSMLRLYQFKDFVLSDLNVVAEIIDEK